MQKNRALYLILKCFDIETNILCFPISLCVCVSECAVNFWTHGKNLSMRNIGTAKLPRTANIMYTYKAYAKFPLQCILRLRTYAC